jgi:hypothetical protein
VAAVLYVVVLGERRNHGRAPSNLADAVEDDLGSSVVEFDGSANLDAVAFQGRTSPTSFSLDANTTTVNGQAI